MEVISNVYSMGNVSCVHISQARVSGGTAELSQLHWSWIRAAVRR